MSEESVEEVTHPGPILRAARDELKMSVEQVADALHLRPSVVLSIESDSYEEFSGDVFLKGYFRSYCRIVGLHEERMVVLLEAQLARLKQEIESEEKEASDARSKQKRVRMLKLLSLVLVLGGIAFSAIWSLTSTQDRLASPEPENIALEESLSQPNLSENIDFQDDDNQAGLTEEQANQDGTQALEESSVSTLVGEDVESVESQALETKTVAAEIMATPELQAESGGFAASSSSESEASLASGALSIAFSDECWIEVYDGEGTRLTADLKRAGSSYSYEGALPIRVVLGNGVVAQATFNDEVYDLAPFIRASGRAEIVFN
jgi:cytoskeleton protein RodZ